MTDKKGSDKKKVDPSDVVFWWCIGFIVGSLFAYLLLFPMMSAL